MKPAAGGPPKPRRSALMAVCVLGVAISLVILGVILFLTYYTGWIGPSDQGSFVRELRDFDALLREAPASAPARLNALLDGLEKRAIGAETHLSVLKRRRNLALNAGSDQALFQGAYREATERAAAAFPYSQPVAALAADALLLGYPDKLSAEDRDKLRGYAALFTEKRLSPLALDIAVLLGDLSDPLDPSIVQPHAAELLAAGASSLDGAEREGFLVNAVLQGLLAGDSVLANSHLVSLLGSSELSERGLRFGAEYYYDANPLRSAELFSRFSDPASLGRMADSLVLAGFPDTAAEIWTALVSPPREAEADGIAPQEPVPTDLLVRSLYNLASVSTEEPKKLAHYERLLSLSPGHVYGIIGYTRLLDADRAAAILAEQDMGQPLLDLELLRRRLEGWEARRAVAETWLLLGRHPQSEPPYRWGAWYFDRQRQYPETALLLRQARVNGIDDPALALHDALRLIREGRIDEGEALLEETDSAAWQVPANLGLIAESRRSLSQALEYYERAASLAKTPSSKAKVQLRIARCLRALGRDAESRRALEKVLELEPENPNARLDLRRLDY